MKGHAPAPSNSKNVVRAGLVLWIILIVLVVVSVFSPYDAGGAVGDPRIPDSALHKDLIKIDLSGIEFPGLDHCKRFIVNAGSGVDPIMFDDPEKATCTIAIEANMETAAKIEAHPNLIVIPVAVSDFWGIKPFYVYRDTSWSSLNKVAATLQGDPQAWVKNEESTVVYVPVAPLAAIVDLIPMDKELLGLKTDLKGSDYRAVASLGSRLSRFKEVHSEVYREGWTWFDPDSNCLETDFLPMMKEHGFNLVWPPSGTKDADVLFRHADYDKFTKTGEFRMS